MAIHTPRVIGFALLIAVSVLSGCARQKYTVRDAAMGDKDFATIRSLKVSDDASRLEVIADKPLVYTYYKTQNPPQAIIDISQTDPGDFIKPISVAGGNIKRVDILKRDVGSGVLTRIEVRLARDTDVLASLDPQDKAKLVVSFAPAPGASTTSEIAAGNNRNTDKPSSEPEGGTAGSGEVAVQPVSTPVAGEQPGAATGTVAGSATQTTVAEGKVPKPATSHQDNISPQSAAGGKASAEEQAKPEGQASGESFLTSLKKGDSSIELVVDGGVKRYEAFSIPDRKGGRIIVDLFGVKNKVSTKTIPIGSFGIRDARIGVSADKVRVVLDGSKENLASYRVVKTPQGVSIVLGKRAQSDEPPVAEPPSAKKDEKAVSKTAETGGAPVEAGSSAVPVSPAPASSKTVAGKPGHLTSVAVVDGGVEIAVAGGVESYKAFLLDNPERLVLDLFGIKSDVKEQVIPVNTFGISKARIGASVDKSRIVLDSASAKFPPYQITKKEDGLNVQFAEKSAKPSEPVVTASKPPVATPSAAPAIAALPPVAGGESTLHSLDFKLTDQGYSRIYFKVDGTCSVGQPVKVREGLSLTIKSCKLPKKMQRMLDTSSFPSVVKSVTPYSVRTRSGNDIRLLARLRDNAPSIVKQEGAGYNWDIKNTLVPAPRSEKAKNVAPQLSQNEEVELTTPLPKQTAPEAKPATAVEIKQPVAEPKLLAKKYTGRRVTLEFSDADIRKIFQLIAEVSNLNFLIADDVSGTISLKLVNVPWDQALDVILESKNLEMKREGNIVQIKPRGRFKTQEQEEGEARRVREKQMEVQTVVIPVNYATVGEVRAQLESLRSQNDKAKIVDDPRTNRVIITDIAPSIEKMREIIKTLDVPEKQVMIEARIVEASNTFARDLGVQWGLKYNDGTASVAGINGLTSSFGGIVSNVLPSGNTGGIATGLSFGKLASNVQLDLRLSAAATTGLIKIVSTPKVVTLNNKAAKISQGQSIPYQTTSAEGTKTEFVEAALVLDVTPHITADGSIGMKIKASNNSPGSGTPPPINKKEALTELQLKDGETTVIGGIFVDSETENDTGVPYLKDIPLLGWLFKSNSLSKSKSELLIFITPRILS